MKMAAGAVLSSRLFLVFSRLKAVCRHIDITKIDITKIDITKTNITKTSVAI